MIKINLTPQKYIDKIYSNIFIAKIFFVFIILFLIIIVISGLKYTELKTLEMDYKSLEQKYNSLSQKVNQSKDIEKQISEINNYISAVDKLNKNRFFYVAFLSDVINNLPDTMWFGGIDTKTRKDYIEVSINLNSNSLEDLLWWYAFLEKGSKRFSDVKITSINFSGGYYNTQISFKYSYII
jgi:hypothetical protein